MSINIESIVERFVSKNKNFVFFEHLLLRAITLTDGFSLNDRINKVFWFDRDVFTQEELKFFEDCNFVVKSTEENNKYQYVEISVKNYEIIDEEPEIIGKLKKEFFRKKNISIVVIVGVLFCTMLLSDYLLPFLPSGFSKDILFLPSIGLFVFEMKKASKEQKIIDNRYLDIFKSSFAKFLKSKLNK